MYSSTKFPPVRIQPAAFAWLKKIYHIMKERGTPESLTALASRAILALPLPNGNGHEPTPELPGDSNFSLPR